VKGVIVSAFSKDGISWRREGRICVGPVPPHALHRVLAPDVVRLDDGSFRMYFEGRIDQRSESILSAVSIDGLSWEIEQGVRLQDKSREIGYGTPCCVRIAGNEWRIYFHRRQKNRIEIISAMSSDGLRWRVEAGVRIAEVNQGGRGMVYSPFVYRSDDGSWKMLYAQWSGFFKKKGRILAARSKDGLRWIKETEPVLSPGGPLDAEHCSEPCLLRLSDGSWRLFYEGKDKSGHWRILSASAIKPVKIS